VINIENFIQNVTNKIKYISLFQLVNLFTMKKIFYVFVVGLVITSCTDNNAPKQIDVQLDDNDPKNEIVFAIPSPNEQFDLLQNLGGEVNTLLVHDLGKLDDYSSAKSIALNFGIYTADAAYMMRYNQGKSVFMNYVSGLDKMGSKLGISQIYGKDLLETIEEAQDDADLLYDISSDNYLKVYDKMIENDKSSELALILSGGWIETMHILFNTAGEFDEAFDIQESITEQRYVLENLIDFISEFKNDSDVADVIEMLNSVLMSYDNLDCESTEVEVKKGENNSMILYGGDSCLFTLESYNAMKALINDLRKTIIA
jgi:hypothetical protein